AGGVCAVGVQQCFRVKTTGTVRNTRLDSLFIDAAMTCELTAKLRPPGPGPTSIFMVAFSVERKEPRFL
uniref:Uncharacterized protein n=1 Tax=Electrophorus electricus TaxID=8005 RepID=A0A4W4ES85_ELEEL